MSALSPAARRGALAGLIAFHILIIIASNYLVQQPMTLFGWQTTWGAFSFPFIFLATDLTVRLLGKGPARQVIARVMLPALRVGHSHTGEEVLAAAMGPGADKVTGFFPNTHLFDVIMGAYGWKAAK